MSPLNTVSPFRMTVTRSHTLRKSTSHTQPILDAARTLLRDAGPMIATRGLTLIGISVSNLDDDAGIQLELPLDAFRGNDLDAALDAVRSRFGSSAVIRAALLGRDQGPTVPLLPD